jgi:NADPH:quinone reductase-like Zn-dependent oxidoreductase
VVGEVDALGGGVSEVSFGERVGALTVTGGYSEYLYWKSSRLIPVPASLDPVEEVALILNYIVAYQALHRSARVRVGEKVLIIGASGGIGTALLQLGRLAELQMVGIASASKHRILLEYGAKPIDYHSQDFVQVTRELEPGGLDVVFNGMMRLSYIKGGLSLLRSGGRLVSYGEPAGFFTLFRTLGTMILVNLLPNGKSFKLYGTSTYFLFDPQPYLDDWAVLFGLLETGQIKPVIMKLLPLQEAALAHKLLESGQVTGNLVLVAPGLQ